MPELQGLPDLRGKVIAFAEPDTNLGSAVVERALVRLGAEPQGFFRRVIYTGDHARVIRAVAGGIAHAGAVMDQSWNAVQASDPQLADNLRVIWRSGWRPLPPLVGAPGLSADSASALQRILLEMQADDDGRALLRALGFDRFVIPDPEHYRAGAEAGGCPE
jgi:phosphonate transport system substrate-binding protein